MDRYSLRHVMAAIIVGEELRVPNITPSPDPYLNEKLLRNQFSALVENAYFITDLMLEIGDNKSLNG